MNYMSEMIKSEVSFVPVKARKDFAKAKEFNLWGARTRFILPFGL